MANDTWTAPSGPSAGAASLSEMQQQRTDNLYVTELVMEGDQSTSGKTHRHKVGTFANRSAAGNAGRLYTATDFAITFYDDGSDWSVVSHNARYVDRYRTDFHAPGANALAASGWFADWRATSGGTAGAVSIKLDDHSSLELLTGANAAGDLWHFTPVGNGSGYIKTTSADNYPLIFECGVLLPSSTTMDAHFGLMDALSSARSPTPSSSIMWRVQDNGNFYTVTRDNDGEASTDAGSAPGTSNYNVFRIEVLSASLSKFYINGTKTGTDHTTGIPSSELLHPGFCIRTNSANARAIRIDHVDLLYKRAALV